MEFITINLTNKYSMATRFRKFRTRKSRRSHALKTRKHKGGNLIPKDLKRMGSDVLGTLSNTAKKIAVTAGIRKSNVDKMFEEENARIANMKKFGSTLKRDKSGTKVNYNN